MIWSTNASVEFRVTAVLFSFWVKKINKIQ